MRNFGVFLSNLRSSTGLSLEELARLVESSRSTLSRLENDEVPQPFKGSTRKLVLALAEILCTSKKETGRYLELAGIDRSLLTEMEEIQLGFTPHIPLGAPDEEANLERWKQMYEQLIQHLGAREVELGISNSPPISSSKFKSMPMCSRRLSTDSTSSQIDRSHQNPMRSREDQFTMRHQSKEGLSWDSNMGKNS